MTTTTTPHEIHGALGYFLAGAAPAPNAARQEWRSGYRVIPRHPGHMLRVTVEFDDRCGNGHATFAITAEQIDEKGAWAAGGCLHEAIAEVFPELAPLLKWHGCHTEGPLHYLANTVYLAGDADCNGLRAGEQQQIRRGGKLPMWERVMVDASGAVVEPGQRYVAAETCPESALREAYVPWMRVGEGKARELDAARRAAVWPEATDAQLSLPAPELRALLEARLPDLMRAFRADVEAAGFYWLGKGEAA